MATTPTPVSDPRNATIASGKRNVQITASQVQPPSPLYIQPEDNFTLLTRSPTAAGAPVIALLMRWLRPDGEIITIRKQFTIASDGATFTFTLGEGFLLSATLVVTGAVWIGTGNLFATLVVQRDTPEAGFFHWVLFADYATTNHFPSWPYGVQKSLADGPGRIRSITGTTPAAGVEISETVPAAVRWKLLGVSFTLNTSAAVANRFSQLLLDDGANIFSVASAEFSHAASLNIRYSFSNGYSFSFTQANSIQSSLPNDLYLNAGFRFRTNTVAIQGADQYSAPQYLVQEWIDV